MVLLWAAVLLLKLLLFMSLVALLLLMWLSPDIVFGVVVIAVCADVVAVGVVCDVFAGGSCYCSGCCWCCRAYCLY